MLISIFFYEEKDMEYIEIGKIVNTHGLKGELKIESWSSFDDERYEKGNTVYLNIDNKYVPFIVASYRKHKGYPLVTFKGYEDINLVEKYKTKIVYIDKDERGELEEDEFYTDELIGLDVFDDENKNIGKVISVEFTNGAQDNLRVCTKDNKEFLVPYVDEFILDVNLDEGYIQIHVMDGLL
jgi:16S rRNA processing protein RimM